MKRRPFTILALLILAAAALQAALGPASPPIAESAGDALPEGMVCTACGPIGQPTPNSPLPSP